MQAQARPLDDQQQKNQKQKKEKDFRKSLSVHTVMALPFLALNHYDSLFLIVYLCVAIALLAYKVQTYPFPNYALVCQGIILAMLTLTQLLRYLLARRSVAHKNVTYLIVYLIGSLFVCLSFIFHLRLQTYVILAEIITNWTGIILIILETLVAVWVLHVFQRKKENH